MVVNDLALAEKLGFDLRQGYYEHRGRYYFNREECYREATRTQDLEVKYHFFDSLWDSLDTTVEPSESLQELYKQRAQQIRDTYDYVILAFSGGADSMNVLHSFLDNGIKLDEVAVSYPISVIEKLRHTFNVQDKSAKNIIFEYDLACKPVLDWLSVYHPEIKITVNDYAPTALALVREGLLQELGYADAPYVSMFSVGRYHLFRNAYEKLDSLQRVGLVFGVDKPLVFWSRTEKRFGMFFSDYVLTRSYWKFKNWQGHDLKPELFYWTADMPQIVLKQAHRLIKSVFSDTDLLASHPELIGSAGTKQVVFKTATDVCKSVIYPKYQPEVWQADPARFNLFSESTAWVDDPNISGSAASTNLLAQIRESLAGIDPSFIVYAPPPARWRRGTHSPTARQSCSKNNQANLALRRRGQVESRENSQGLSGYEDLDVELR